MIAVGRTIIPACLWYEDAASHGPLDGSDPTSIDREYRRVFIATARWVARWTTKPDYPAASARGDRAVGSRSAPPSRVATRARSVAPTPPA